MLVSSGSVGIILRSDSTMEEIRREDGYTVNKLDVIMVLYFKIFFLF